MVDIQVISKVLNTGDYSIIEDNSITEDYFKREPGELNFVAEFNFIKEHYEQYGNVPDTTTFLAKFRDFEIVEVTESDRYLVDAFREEYLFRRSAPILKQAVNIFNEDANAGVEYMLKELKNLTPDYHLGGTDIISQAHIRLEHYKDRIDHQDDYYFSSGFVEVDSVTHGIKRRGELYVIFARTNHGKSWVLETIISHIWKMGYNVGYISPEMEDDDIGYRFDTVYKGFSNRDLTWGLTNINLEEYEKHIAELKEHKNCFMVSTPDKFDNKITISKLRNYIKQYKLDALAIDGITYLTDERGKRNDNKTTSLTNISEDLKLLSLEMGVPILVVVQANRSGVVDKDSDKTPELESIRDSDGISHNATKVLSLRHKDEALAITVSKNREGSVNNTFKYLWNVNVGEFIYTENTETENETQEEKEVRREKKKASGKDVF